MLYLSKYRPSSDLDLLDLIGTPYKKDTDDADPEFMRFGRRGDSGDDYEFLRFGRDGDFLRFGRGGDYLRFGRGEDKRIGRGYHMRLGHGDLMGSPKGHDSSILLARKFYNDVEHQKEDTIDKKKH